MWLGINILIRANHMISLITSSTMDLIDIFVNLSYVGTVFLDIFVNLSYLNNSIFRYLCKFNLSEH